LTADGAVQKRLLEAGSGASPKKGNTVQIDYVGTIGKVDWDVDGVIDCWLLSQQGLEKLANGFREANIDAFKLMDNSVFTEEFVANTFNLSNKIQVKKLVMAAKRLAKTVSEYPEGSMFDSNQDRGPYKFELGANKVIRAMDLAVLSMKEGERALIKCRTDYAYGKEGLRRASGDVVVPEYATLCFDIKLLQSS
jgi:hypothetical protein